MGPQNAFLATPRKNTISIGNTKRMMAKERSTLHIVPCYTEINSYTELNSYTEYASIFSELLIN